MVANLALMIVFAEILEKKHLREFGDCMSFHHAKDVETEPQCILMSIVGNKQYVLGSGETEDAAFQHAIDSVAIGLTPFCLD